jgi:hypothetical protein
MISLDLLKAYTDKAYEIIGAYKLAENEFNAACEAREIKAIDAAAGKMVEQANAYYASFMSKPFGRGRPSAVHVWGKVFRANGRFRTLMNRIAHHTKVFQDAVEVMQMKDVIRAADQIEKCMYQVITCIQSVNVPRPQNPITCGPRQVENFSNWKNWIAGEKESEDPLSDPEEDVLEIDLLLSEIDIEKDSK